MGTSIAVRFPAIRLTRSSPLTRFIGVGVVSTCAYALLFVALSGPLGSVVASAIALIVTAVANTAANRRLTFGVRGRAGLLRQQLAGLVVFGVALALTTGALAALHGLDAHPSRLLEVSAVVVANLGATVTRYVALSAWVFRASSHRPLVACTRARALSSRNEHRHA